MKFFRNIFLLALLFPAFVYGKTIINGKDAIDTVFLGTPYERHVQLPAGTASLGPTAPSAQTYNTVFRCIEFDSDAEEAFITFEIPDDWVGNENMILELDWIPWDDDVTNGETVKWDIQYRASVQNSDVDGTLSSATATHTDSGNVTVQGFMVHTPVTLNYNDANNPLNKQAHLYIQITRDVTTDTFPGGACITAWEWIYNSNMLPQI